MTFLAVSLNFLPFFVGVRVIRACSLLFGICMGSPDCWKLALGAAKRDAATA